MQPPASVAGALIDRRCGDPLQCGTMRETTLLLPFALPPAEHAKDLLAALDAPALAQLLARGTPAQGSDCDPFAAALPHESLLYGNAGDNSPPLAAALMHKLGVPSDEGFWFVLQPAHLHVALDHLVLTDLRQLALDEAESRALFDAALPLFEESGFALRYGDAGRWFLRADDWRTLRTATPDAATGRNIDVWLPSGDAARAWRKLHNEVQMLWHLQPLNEAREMRGLRRVNALWLWGGSTAATPTARPETLFDDTLISPALAGDWGDWLAGMVRVEEAHAKPLLAALKSGALDSVRLQLTDATRLRAWRATRSGMRKFWVKPSLSRLSA